MTGINIYLFVLLVSSDGGIICCFYVLKDILSDKNWKYFNAALPADGSFFHAYKYLPSIVAMNKWHKIHCTFSNQLGISAKRNTALQSGCHNGMFVLRDLDCHY